MFIIVMGVSRSSKNTIARMLAQRLGWRLYDGDTFHPPANIAKMDMGDFDHRCHRHATRDSSEDNGATNGN